MPTYHKTLTVDTAGKCDMIDMTSRVKGILAESGLKNGTCTVYCTGSTCSIMTTEYESGLLDDFGDAMERLVPQTGDYRHDKRWGEKNGHSHIRASIVGPGLTVPFVDGRLVLGTWQQITLVDFDVRARSRTVEIMLVGE